MRRSMSSLWWRDSNKTASRKTGAVQSRSFGADWHGERIVVLGMTTSFESHEVAHIQAYPATAALMAAMVSTLFASMRDIIPFPLCRGM